MFDIVGIPEINSPKYATWTLYSRNDCQYATSLRKMTEVFVLYMMPETILSNIYK